MRPPKIDLGFLFYASKKKKIYIYIYIYLNKTLFLYANLLEKYLSFLNNLETLTASRYQSKKKK